MVDKLHKISIPAGTVNTVQSVDFTPDCDGKRAFRIKDIRFSISALDALADQDEIGIEITKSNPSGAAALLELDDLNLIYKGSKRAELLGTNGSLQWSSANEAISCKKDPKFPDPEGIMLQKGEQYYIGIIATGQDGAIAAEIEVLGKGVNKVSDDDLANFANNTI